MVVWFGVHQHHRRVDHGFPHLRTNEWTQMDAYLRLQTGMKRIAASKAQRCGSKISSRQDAIETSKVLLGGDHHVTAIELIDHIMIMIIDLVNDRETLEACSLVSLWPETSIRTSRIHHRGPATLVCPDLPRTVGAILPRRGSDPIGVPSLVRVTFANLASLINLHRCRFSFPVLFRASGAGGSEMARHECHCVSSVLHSFGSSLENATRLTLRKVTIHPSTLAMFVGHFPRLDDLSVSVVNVLRMLEGTGDLYQVLKGYRSIAHISSRCRLRWTFTRMLS